MAYAGTQVSVERSQGEVRKLLGRHGAQRFTFSEGIDDDGRSWVLLEFVHAQEYDRPHLIRMAVPLKLLDEEAIARKVRNARSRDANEIRMDAAEQERRRIWRVLFYSLKSRMEAVEEEVETFEQAFLPHIVDPATNATIWQRVQPAVEAGLLVIGGSGLPALGDGKPRVRAGR